MREIATKGDCSQVELVCWPRSIHVPYFFSCISNVFLHNTINGTLRYTNFPSNLSLSTVCLGKSPWLKRSVSTSSILSAFGAVCGRPLPGRRFEVPVGIRSILRIILFNPLRDQLLLGNSFKN